MTDSITVENHTAGDKTPPSSLFVMRRLEYIPPLPTKSNSHILHVYLIGVILSNLLLLFFKGYSADLGYWESWTKQLSVRGYENFDGNYPPLYVHWLYIVGKFYALIGMPIEHNNFLKFLTQIPVTVSHCFLTTIIFHCLHKNAKPSLWLHPIMALTAFNPAILINGPIWGQVDLIPATLLLCALLLAVNPQRQIFAIPMFVLALLTKFQMIAFAPVFGFLFFRHIGKNFIGIIIAIAVGAIVFLPSILAGHFWQSVKQAYIDTLGQYPLTTFNAANIWILLTGNTARDSQILFGVDPNSILAYLFTAKYFGMLLFILTALWVFVQGIIGIIKNSFYSREILTTHALFGAMLCAVAFFTLLPAMHERYLFPAVVMALAYTAIARKNIAYPIAISLLSAINMLIILEINGSNIWEGLALLMVIVFIYNLIESVGGKSFSRFIQGTGQFFYRIPLLSVWFFIIAIPLMTLYFYNRYHIHNVDIQKNQLLLTNLPWIYAQQDHGSLKINQSFDGNILSLDSKRYAQGIGTHANSDIQYQLPHNVASLSFLIGLDDEVGTADVQFSVWGDNKVLWESAILYGNESSPEKHEIDLRGIRLLNLKVHAVTDDKWDHANWIAPVLTLDVDTK